MLFSKYIGAHDKRIRFSTWHHAIDTTHDITTGDLQFVKLSYRYCSKKKVSEVGQRIIALAASSGKRNVTV